MRAREFIREAAGSDLRRAIVHILEKIYFEASGGEDMTDDIVDKLGDYFDQVQRSQDPELQMAYEEMRDRVDTEPEEQAVVALAGIRLLMGPGYRPRPRRPLDAQGQAWVNNVVAQFGAALKKANIKTGPKDVQEGGKRHRMSQHATGIATRQAEDRRIAHNKKIYAMMRDIAAKDMRPEDKAAAINALQQQIIREQGVSEAADDFYEDELSGEESNQIMQRIWRSLYPKVTLHVFEEDTGMPGWSTDPDPDIWSSLTQDPDDFLLTTRGNSINTDEGNMVSVDFAKSGRYRGVIKPYIKACFEAMERKWQQEYPDGPLPPRKIVLFSREGSGGVWPAIAKSLGAGLEDTPYH